AGATLTSNDKITWTVGNLTSLTADDGHYELDLIRPGSEIVDSVGNALAGSTTVQWDVDTVAPQVTAITRTDPNPAGAAPVHWSVTFSEPASGLAKANFSLVESGFAGSSITSVTGGGTNWTVTASTGVGTGTLGVNLANSTGATDAAGNAIGNLPFTGD